MPQPLKRPPQPRLRSLLYVPGNKLEWMLKAPRYGSDALILDLEDSVPPDQKTDSRKLVRQAVDELGPAGGPRITVRINDVRTGRAQGDLEAVVAKGLFGVFLPKADGPEDIQEVDAILGALEARAGLPAGQIFIMPLIESAQGVRNAYDIAMASARVGYMNAAVGSKVGDMVGSIGFCEVTGQETVYIYGKIIVDARAAGIANPVIGLVSDPIHDVFAVRSRAERGRNYGFRGAMLIHPSHVKVAHEVFAPSQSDLDYWTGLVKAVDDGEAHGTSAVLYHGTMVDIAHRNHAREMLRLAKGE